MGGLVKLAFLAPEFLPPWGGVGIYSVELIKQLSQHQDMDIHVITPRRGKGYDRRSIEKYFGDKITIHNISNANDGFFYNFYFQLAILKDFNTLNKKHHFDLMHSANLVHMPDIYLKFQKQKIPSLTTVHTTLQSQSKINGNSKLESKNRAMVEKMTSVYYPVIKTLEKAYIKRTKNFIAVSHWVSKFLSPMHKHTLEVIHNGIDTKRFSKKAKGEFTFLQDKNMPIVLYTGRLLAMKGLSTLIKAMKEVLQYTQAHFVFAGSGDKAQWNDDLKTIHSEYYSFLGYVPYEKIHELYAACDIFVLPSYTESFPLSILEAMASSKPVIATTVGGIPEMIENAKNGILVEPGNEKQLAQSLILLISDPALRKKIAGQGLKQVQDNFDSKLMASKTKSFYETVLVQ